MKSLPLLQKQRATTLIVGCSVLLWILSFCTDAFSHSSTFGTLSVVLPETLLSASISFSILALILLFIWRPSQSQMAPKRYWVFVLILALGPVLYWIAILLTAYIEQLKLVQNL